jgi:hypothetical protein
VVGSKWLALSCAVTWSRYQPPGTYFSSDNITYPLQLSLHNKSIVCFTRLLQEIYITELGSLSALY